MEKIEFDARLIVRFQAFYREDAERTAKEMAGMIQEEMLDRYPGMSCEVTVEKIEEK